ncbi:type IV pilus modification protein PilV [Motiliproteus sp. SC1-56]|uniref:type IV pilus modification protein PilV n=1 Tax=Motiliproteus sp. SC1-56 TaxID=2799565 RepID=UPI001A8DF4C4|nr:type IV pilus modification protein PilV [Motiliproteus sp. SC1-56]
MPMIINSVRPWARMQAGVSMLEVLIALVLITTALLGATALQITGLQNNRSAYYRSQASLLAYDMADRLRVNAGYALANSSAYAFHSENDPLPSATSCITDINGCTDGSLRDQDLREWAENFKDVTGIGHDGADYRPLLPGGVGSVTASGSLYSITVSWDEVDWNVGGGSNKSTESKQFSLDFNLTD